jgi:hypothetical protein
VVLVEDGTCSEVVNVEYSCQDTNTHEEARNYKHFKAEADEYNPGGQDEGAGDGGKGLDEDGHGEVCPGGGDCCGLHEEDDVVYVEKIMTAVNHYKNSVL